MALTKLNNQSIGPISEFNNPVSFNSAITTAGGVYLGGTGAANYLDDYEEGTWTPVLSGSFTYSIQGGTYTKVGRLVVLNCMIQWSANASSSPTTALVTGFPFASISSGTYRSGAGIGYVNGVDTSAEKQLVFTMSGGDTGGGFYLLRDNTSPLSGDVGAWSSSGELQFTISYMTA